MPSGHSQLMLDAMRLRNQDVYATLEIDLGSDTLKISDEYVPSKTSGMYLRRISQWGEFDRPGPDRSYHLVGAKGSAVIEDINGDIGRLLGGPHRGAIKGAMARGHWREKYVPNEDHAQFFSGRVAGFSGQPRVYRIDLVADSLPLESRTNKIPKLFERDWPRAPENSWGRDGQAVYGRHRSTGLLDSAGLIEAIPVNRLANIWYVSIGRLKLNLVAVYRTSGGTTTLETADWTLSHLKRNGIWYTVLTHDPGTADQDNDTVRCDLDGLEYVGDGSGALITSGVDQVVNALTNFNFGDWVGDPPDEDGTWIAPSTVPINTTHMATTKSFFDLRGYAHSRVVRTSDRGIDILNSFCGSEKVGPFWSWDWKLAILPIDHGQQEIDTGNEVTMEDVAQPNVGQPTRVPGVSPPSFRPRSVANRFVVSYLRDDAAGALKRGPVTVVDPDAPFVVEELNDMDWQESSII